MAICPIHSLELTVFEKNGDSTFLQCPEGEMYMTWGLAPMTPIPSIKVVQEIIISTPADQQNVVLSLPKPGQKKIISIERTANGELKIDVRNNSEG